jgi:hypothetical protein
VLKGRVQSWLVQKNEVLAFVQAAPEGGAGALVVLLRLRIQSAVWKKLSLRRSRRSAGTPVSPMAWSMQASHWSRSRMPMENGMCRARRRGVAKALGVVLGPPSQPHRNQNSFCRASASVTAVGGAQLGVAGLQVHQVVKALDQRLDTVFTTNPFKRGGGAGWLFLQFDMMSPNAA